MEQKIKGAFGRYQLEISTGKVAKQANGSVVVKLDDNIILVTAVASKDRKEGQDFFPLTVDYRERYYATGKIPGGFFKREGKPRDREILASRLIDRPIRPLFPDDFMNETQIIAALFSADGKIDTDVLGVIGASAALYLSDIPFNGPVGACRVAMIDKQLVDSPTFEELQNAELEVVIAGTETTVTTIESSANEVSEEDMLRAIEFGHERIKESIKLQKELAEKIKVKKMVYEPFIIPDELKEKIRMVAVAELPRINEIFEKQARNEEFYNLVKKIKDELKEGYPDFEHMIPNLVEDVRKEMIREKIINKGIRLDGRKVTDIRNITCEIGVMPRIHGSALFTRGETQSLGCLTLGTSSDEQTIEDLEGESSKSFMLHYNFPPFSVGEVGRMSGPGRREIGHGFLAEKSLQAIIPSEEKFPYTIRIVSEILESNGSSSMASTCAACLALMDGGVPIKNPVSGIAMGLMMEMNDKKSTEDKKYLVLTDVQGEEDHYGDMDFKAAGTKNGITALQMDIKVRGITYKIMKDALEQSKKARIQILAKMAEALPEPRIELSPNAPRIYIIKIRPDQIGDVIGTGGKIINEIIDECGVLIDIEETGEVFVTAENEASAQKALEWIKNLTKEVAVGELYQGKIKRILEFGAFAEILPGQEGMIHISQLAKERVNKVTDVVKVGDVVPVKVISIDEQGRINLSLKEARK
jgi:polyribonucleotide nucleotidyltransferase